MPEKKSKKVTFSENAIATITQRYDVATVLTVFQELSHYAADENFNWNELVKKTTTGISTAREYQMLWRHLAYGYSFPEDLDQEAQPMDDDSDLDCELESLPSGCAESTSETSACVKVIIASRTLSESTPSSATIEAPMTVNFPVCHSSRTSNISQPSILMDQSSIMFPVTVPRQTLPTVSSTDALETKVTIGGTAASKRKRKAWSEEEDNLLRDAVQKWGEGNWATMAKGDSFPIKRSATQLSQRWSALRKKDGSANPGPTATTVTTNTQYTAEQLATRHSLNLALDMPFKKLSAPGVTDPGRTSTSIKNQVQPRNTAQFSTIRSSVPSQRPAQQACGSPTKPKLASENSVSKCNAMSARESKPGIVHSGAQTQTVSRTNAAPHLMVSQAKNVAHTVPACSTLTKTPISAGGHQKIRSNVPAGSSLTKTPISTGLAPVQPNVNVPDGRSLSRTPIAAGLPSNQKVHSNVHVGSSLTKIPISAGLPSNQKVYSNVPAASSLTKTPNSAGLPSDPKVHSNVLAGNSLTKTPISTGLPSDQKDKHVTSVKEEEKRLAEPGSTPKENVKEEASTSTTEGQVNRKLDKARLDLDKAKSMPSEEVLEHKAVPQNPVGSEERGSVKNSNFTPNKATENGNDNLNKESQNLNQDKKTSSVNENSQHQNMKEKLVNLPKQDECRQGLEVP
ncbi:myb-like DNA-binding domain protein [Medicago truncatula]|uniref:Myb-like DNA-binding domain protein n=1 Tax=Medicago truncatula TaxID=3880 RepID=A0A072V2Z2_MEDTR|nr:myb-like DNA-binding domain protein [Medicago truncatula]